MTKFFDSRPKIVAASIGVVLVAILAVLGGISLYYSSHALPGATVAGQSVSGMTREQVAEHINQQVSGDVVQLEGQVDPVDVTLADAGVTVDVDQMVDEVFAPNRGTITRVTALFSNWDVEPMVQVETATFDSFCAALESEALGPAAEGQVVFDEGSQTFVAHPSEVGSEVNTEELANDLVASVKAMDFAPIEVEVVEVKPAYDTASVQAAADLANAWLTGEVTVWDRYDSAYSPETVEMAKWIEFNERDGQLIASLNASAIQPWLETVVVETNTEPDPGVQNVNSAGEVVAVAYEGADGYTANNVEALAAAISAALVEGQPYEGRVEYDVTERTYTQRLIADGAELLAYPAAPGEKWIDINLSNFSVVAYEGATPVLQSAMVPGAPQTPTITGQFNVWAKVPVQTMRGNNADGTKYETPDVPWILYFHGGYATHGAYWRSNFGYDAGASGSHGCVNMPVDAAKALYDWADVGITVVSRY